MSNIDLRYRYKQYNSVKYGYGYNIIDSAISDENENWICTAFTEINAKRICSALNISVAIQDFAKYLQE